MPDTVLGYIREQDVSVSACYIWRWPMRKLTVYLWWNPQKAGWRKMTGGRGL